MEQFFLFAEIAMGIFLAVLVFAVFVPRKKTEIALLTHKEEQKNKVMMTFRTENVPQFTLTFLFQGNENKQEKENKKERKFIVSQALYNTLEEGEHYQVCWNKGQLLSCNAVPKESEQDKEERAAK